MFLPAMFDIYSKPYSNKEALLWESAETANFLTINAIG